MVPYRTTVCPSNQCQSISGDENFLSSRLQFFNSLKEELDLRQSQRVRFLRGNLDSQVSILANAIDSRVSSALNRDVGIRLRCSLWLRKGRFPLNKEQPCRDTSAADFSSSYGLSTVHCTVPTLERNFLQSEIRKIHPIVPRIMEELSYTKSRRRVSLIVWM